MIHFYPHLAGRKDDHNRHVLVNACTPSLTDNYVVSLELDDHYCYAGLADSVYAASNVYSEVEESCLVCRIERREGPGRWEGSLSSASNIIDMLT